LIYPEWSRSEKSVSHGSLPSPSRREKWIRKRLEILFGKKVEVIPVLCKEIIG